MSRAVDVNVSVTIDVIFNVIFSYGGPRLATVLDSCRVAFESSWMTRFVMDVEKLQERLTTSKLCGFVV